jgi:hypothetical protein
MTYVTFGIYGHPECLLLILIASLVLGSLVIKRGQG